MSDTVKIENIEVGMSSTYSQTVTDADIKAFAGVSGDHNPVHMSDEYANESRFGKRIAHGLLSASFFLLFLVRSYQDLVVFMLLKACNLNELFLLVIL